MTKKEKFFQAIDELGAKRVAYFGWAYTHNDNVWLAYHCGDVHIFRMFEDEGLFIHNTVSAEQCHWNNMVLCDIIYLTDLDGNDQPLCEDERILLRTFATDDEQLSDEELMHAVFLIFSHCDSIANSVSSIGWSQRIDYEDDVDYESMLRLDDETHSIICQIQGLFNWLDDHNVGYFISENGTIQFWNAEQMEMVTGSDRKFEDISLRHAYRTNCITGSTIYMPSIDPRDTGFKRVKHN